MLFKPKQNARRCDNSTAEKAEEKEEEQLDNVQRDSPAVRRQSSHAHKQLRLAHIVVRNEHEMNFPVSRWYLPYSFPRRPMYA